MRLGLINLLGELELWDDVRDFEEDEDFRELVIDMDEIEDWLEGSLD